MDGLPGPKIPNRRFITVSPGATAGTQAPNDLKLPLRIAAKYVMPALGICHKLEVGAKRLVRQVTPSTSRFAPTSSLWEIPRLA